MKSLQRYFAMLAMTTAWVVPSAFAQSTGLDSTLTFQQFMQQMGINDSTSTNPTTNGGGTVAASLKHRVIFWTFDEDDVSYKANGATYIIPEQSEGIPKVIDTVDEIKLYNQHIVDTREKWRLWEELASVRFNVADETIDLNLVHTGTNPLETNSDFSFTASNGDYEKNLKNWHKKVVIISLSTLNTSIVRILAAWDTNVCLW
ncbi:MAG: hypothetical protein R3A45_05750 [Bdellovibrionota bacterium]